MTEKLPAPPVPIDADLRDFDGFMLNVERLLASELWALASGEEFKAAVGLWCRSWKQVPPGSLPNDERVLAAFSGAGRRWKVVRDMAMRGFYLCSDGRLYHRVLCEDVLRAIKAKEDRRERTRAATEARKKKRDDSRDDERDENRDDTRDVERDVPHTDNVTRSHRQDRTGQKKKEEETPPTPQGGRELVDTVDDEFERWYAAYPLHKGRGQALRAYRTARKKASAEALIAGAQRYAADANRKPEFTKHPATWLNGECWADDTAPPADPFEPPDFLDHRPKPNGTAAPGTYLGRPTRLRDDHDAIKEHRHLTLWLDKGIWCQPWNGTWNNADEPRSPDEARARLAALEPVIWPNETEPNPGGPKAPAAQET